MSFVFVLVSFITRRLPTLDPNLQAALDAVMLLFQSLLTTLSGIIFPATPSAMSTIVSFGVIIPLLFVVLAFVFKLIKSKGSS
jgi:hypothetical protein